MNTSLGDLVEGVVAMYETIVSLGFEDDIRRCATELSKGQWHIICSQKHPNKKLKEYFIRECANYVDWNKIYIHAQTIDFIREYKNKLDWTALCAWYAFTMEQLEEFKDYIDWFQVSKWQFLTPKFIRNHLETLDLYEVRCNPNIKLKGDFRDFLLEFAIKKGDIDPNFNK